MDQGAMNCSLNLIRQYLNGGIDDDEERLDFLLHLDDCSKCRDLVFQARRALNSRSYKRRPKTCEPVASLAPGRAGEESDVKKETLGEAIIRAIKNHRTWMSCGAVAEAVGKSGNTVSGRLKLLVDEEKLTRYYSETQKVFLYGLVGWFVPEEHKSEPATKEEPVVPGKLDPEPPPKPKSLVASGSIERGVPIDFSSTLESTDDDRAVTIELPTGGRVIIELTAKDIIRGMGPEGFRLANLIEWAAWAIDKTEAPDGQSAL